MSDLAWDAKTRMSQSLGQIDLNSLRVWKLKQPVNSSPTYLTEVDRILRDFPPVDTFEENDHVQQLTAADNIAQHFTGGATLQAFIQFAASVGGMSLLLVSHRLSLSCKQSS